jgi:hypothetical protein
MDTLFKDDYGDDDYWDDDAVTNAEINLILDFSE